MSWEDDTSTVTFPVPKPTGWPIGRLCGHPQPIKIWFPTVFEVFLAIFIKFYKNSNSEFSVNYMVQKCFGSLKTSQRALEIILSQYNGEKKVFIEFWKLSVNPQFSRKSWFRKIFCVFLLKNLVTFEEQFFYFFFNRPQQRPYERQKFLPTDSNKIYLLQKCFFVKSLANRDVFPLLNRTFCTKNKSPVGIQKIKKMFIFQSYLVDNASFVVKWKKNRKKLKNPIQKDHKKKTLFHSGDWGSSFFLCVKFKKF